MREERLEVSVTFDEQRGIAKSACRATGPLPLCHLAGAALHLVAGGKVAPRYFAWTGSCTSRPGEGVGGTGSPIGMWIVYPSAPTVEPPVTAANSLSASARSSSLALLMIFLHPFQGRIFPMMDWSTGVCRGSRCDTY